MKTYELTVRSEGNVIFQDVVESKFGKWVIKEEALSELSATQSDLATALSQLAEAREGLRVVTEINKEYMELAYLAVLVADGMQGGRGRMRLLIAERDSARAEVAALRTIIEADKSGTGDDAVKITILSVEIARLKEELGNANDLISRMKIVLGIDISQRDADSIVVKARDTRSALDSASARIAELEEAVRFTLEHCYDQWEKARDMMQASLATRDGGTTEAQP